MIDTKIYTFLKLCEEMNYRKTAEILNMTQPAVTQHIHSLENLYNCKLFIYEGKTLYKTEKAMQLEIHARSIIYDENNFKKHLAMPSKQKIAIGATKTIGEYVINNMLLDLLKDDTVDLTVIVDNTENLFEKLHTFKLDFLMVEGYFNKKIYDYNLIKEEELVGICAKDHPFAGKKVMLNDIFAQHIILRENGSGTKDVLEHFLKERGFTFDQFKKISTISSFNLIHEAVKNNVGVSFVYNSIPQKSSAIATFSIENYKITHELNYVFLKNTKSKNYFLTKCSLK